MSAVNWSSLANLPEERTRTYGRCEICGRRDETVAVLLFIRDYDPDTIESVPVQSHRCPTLCAACLEDEPSAEDLARRMIG